MLISKVTSGFVVQSFDTETRKFTDQRFVAGDDVKWEKENGDPINENEVHWKREVDEPYLPFDMIQPYWPSATKIEVVDNVEKFINRIDSSSTPNQ